MSGEEYDMSRPCRVCGAGIDVPCRRYTNEFEKEGAMLGDPTPWPHRFGGRGAVSGDGLRALADEWDRESVAWIDPPSGARIEILRALDGPQ